MTNPLKLLRIYNASNRVINELEKAKMNKALWKSKTFWFNLLTASASFVGVIPLDPHITAVVVGVINIGLRLVTETPVSVTGK